MPKIPVAKKRVAAYCRVSTFRNEQDESFETQQKYYEELIQSHPDWELVKVYADRHSATRVKNRPGFQEMAAAAEAKKLDIIICKSISRFSRNMVDCQQYAKWFRTLGVTIIFEEQNIRTDDPTCDFVLSILAAVAQDESHSISENEKAAYASRFARGEYNLGNNRILGYDCVDGELVPNKDAWIVKEVFRRFIEGESYRQIAKGLEELGAQSLHSKKGFGVETLRYMVSNETYVGDKRLQKKAPLDYLTKKPNPNQKVESNYLWDDHEAIIDRETWDKAQEILEKRKELAKVGIHKTNREHHFLYGKVFCGECGAPFLRRTLKAAGGFKTQSITFNTACIAGLEDVVYVNIMFNSDLKRLVVKGCNENDRDALRWCIAKPDKRKSRKMSCRLFSELLYKEMDWSGDCRYKILGYRIEFEGEALYVFDLVAAEVFHECKKKQSADQQPTTVAEENTEEQPVNPRKGYYPDDIAGTFGMPVEQHRQESELRQMDGFVSVGMLTGMPGQQQNL